MEVRHDPSVPPDPFHRFVVGFERESSAFADGSYRRESRGLFLARDGVHMPQGCGLCWRTRVTRKRDVWQCFRRLAPPGSDSRRNLTKHEEPVKIEQDLMKAIPKDWWILFSHQVIHFRRNICEARKPKCGEDK
jgi:hypothetical protein